jgi:hypothetical protein
LFQLTVLFYGFENPFLWDRIGSNNARTVLADVRRIDNDIV